MWKTVKLGDVCDFQNGFAFKSALFKERGKPILRISNIQNEKIDVRKTVYFDAKDYDTDFTRYEVKPDDLLIAMSGATTGKIGFNKTDTTYYLNQRVGKFKPKPTLDKVFLYYLLSTKVQENLSISKGAAQPNLSSEQIKNISFSLPPLAEQQRIIAKLDAAFAEIDGAIKAVEKKIENITFVFSQILDGLVNASDLGKEVLLGDVCKLSQGLAINKSTKHLLVDISTQPLLRIKDLISNKVEQYIDDSYRNEKTRVTKEDIVFTRTGSLGLAFRGMEGVLHNNSFKVEPEISLSSDYLFWWLKHPTFLEKIHSVAAKAAQPDISHKLFSAQSMRLPTLEKQAEIVSKIEKLMPIIESLTKLYRNKLESFMSLKSAVLAQELQSEAA